MSKDSHFTKDSQGKNKGHAKLETQDSPKPHVQMHHASGRNTAQLLAKHKNRQQERQYINPTHVPEPTIVEEVGTDIMSDIAGVIQGPALDAPKAFFKKGLSKAKAFALRVVVHVSALFCAGVMVTFVPSFAALGVYIGLVCLVARDTSMETDWLAPTGFGIVQMLICLALGIPMTHAIFWGGAQAWVQRLFAKRFSMGTEWLALTLLLPLSLQFSADIINILPFIASFGALAVGGGVFWSVRAKLQSKKREEQTAPPKNNAKDAIIENKPVEKKDGPYEVYKESIAKLRSKQLLIPADMQKSLKNLILAADAIVLCMQEDNRDKEVGEKFLRRYLPATHSVLDKFCRLSGSKVGDNNNNEDMLAALKESGEILQRLEQAFANEHKSLLRNDIDDFSADLKVLDTLLKMDGR